MPVETHLGKIVRITETGEWARARLACTSGPEAGTVEVGLLDGSTRRVAASGLEAATGYPKELRAIPVFPDKADYSTRPMGVCEKEECGITGNLIHFRQHTKGPVLIWCTHCYAAQGTHTHRSK